jgi:hypothetical protein
MVEKTQVAGPHPHHLSISQGHDCVADQVFLWIAYHDFTFSKDGFLIPSY